MTANQISWWMNQENIRSHMQNELNERNKQSITQSLGEEQNRISNQKMKNDFVLGQQGNQINQQQADTAARRASQDYDIGLKNVENVRTRNANDYEIGTGANVIKGKEVSNNYILGVSGQKIQSIRNAQDYAIGKLQQASNAKQAEAALLSSSAQFGKLNPAQIVVALAAPTAQKVVTKGADKISKYVEKVTGTNTAPTSPKPATSVTSGGKTDLKLNAAQKAIVNSPRSGVVPTVKPKPVVKQKATPKPSVTTPRRMK